MPTATQDVMNAVKTNKMAAIVAIFIAKRILSAFCVIRGSILILLNWDSSADCLSCFQQVSSEMILISVSAFECSTRSYFFLSSILGRSFA